MDKQRTDLHHTKIPLKWFKISSQQGLWFVAVFCNCQGVLFQCQFQVLEPRNMNRGSFENRRPDGPLTTNPSRLLVLVVVSNFVRKNLVRFWSSLEQSEKSKVSTRINSTRKTCHHCASMASLYSSPASAEVSWVA